MKKIIVQVLFSLLSVNVLAHNSPRLTVIFVVDQLAYAYVPKLKNNFTSGLKMLLEKGVNYTSAYLPHAMPATGTGHAGLSTGTYAKDHGIIANGWYDPQGNYCSCDDDSSPNTFVFSPTGLYDFGKSPKNIMVDSISDSYIINSPKEKNRFCCSVSLKNRAAICTAGRKGKAIWFDNKAGYFTSSKAYYEQLPDWLNAFNKQQTFRDSPSLIWHSLYPQRHKAYSDVHNLSYKYARYDFKLVGKNVAPARMKNEAKPFDMWSKTPFANTAVLNLGKAVIDEYMAESNNNEMLLWVCPSSLDKVGHFYGPHSKEVIDMIYHLDKGLGDFIAHAQKKVGAKNVMFGLTADHGVMPFVEIINSRGELEARRISVANLENQINCLIREKYGIAPIISNFKAPDFYLNHEKLDNLPQDEKERIIEDIKKQILLAPGIKNVWTAKELVTLCFESHAIENYFKFQHYPGRSGDIVIQTQPNNMLSSHLAGSSHRNPYEDNTHIPLIFYQEGQFECKHITQRVWGLQLANTLAEIFHIPKPSASTLEVLPGLFDGNSPITRDQSDKECSNS